ncbi:calcium-translocating P-type ATPase [Dichomitus squalens LYAD-421 SS1]|uniref:calcium-translocating P-type ATPase n=1 Tax=Dichomitus squalens (strain LYAD-421) TaxID=732165 RepID=UPI0004414357|nr:calcium-translocating P-type ATPase [Dichomitus squalens LYAD-421 SS1]EJF64840.1 calcium-translocating P-type ATPase [Dichomitus squalens LYAD-421 SS1]
MQPLTPQHTGDGSTIVSPTQTHCDGASDADATTVRGSLRSRPKLDEPPSKGSGEGAHEEREARPALDLAQDENIDAGPFSFKPYRLASLVDPKNLDLLKEMGGVTGLLQGLGTHRKKGLSRRALGKAPDVSHHESFAPRVDKDSRPGAGAGDGASQRHDREPEASDVPKLVLTGPGDEDGGGISLAGSRTDLGEDAGDAEQSSGSAYDANLEERRRVFGANTLPIRKTKSLLQLMWLALKDKVLVLLSIAAIVSLALGFFQDFGTPRPAGEPPVDWVEGVAIMVAIIIVVMVGSVNDWQKERQFQALNERKEERGVKVIRDGVEMIVDIKEVVVGDVALVEPGEIVPCDGVFLSGHNVKCDESGATGESDAIKKISYEDCLKSVAEEGAGGGDPLKHTDCFMISGSKVQEGYGSYVVIAVGTRSFNGRIMMALRGDSENTPLQLKLNDLAELIAKLGSAAGLVLFVALMIRFFVQLGTHSVQRTPSQWGIAFVQILIISVTLIVVAVPEGLPLAVTLALAFATKRMTKENLLVRVLGSCETMANASVICTDKTGTLTQNAMTVVAGSVGIHCKFVHHLEDNKARTNADEEPNVWDTSTSKKHTEDFSIDLESINDTLSPAIQDLLNKAIAINSTAFEDDDPETGKKVFVGSKTETALLKFAKENGWTDYKELREAADIVQMLPFSSDRKAMGVVVRLDKRHYRVYLKGASEILTKRCTRHIVVERGSKSDEIGTSEIDDSARDNIQRTIIFYANQTLRTIAICYRDFDCWPPPGTNPESEDEVPYEDLSSNLTLIGITGIEDPLRPGVREAVADCRKAGVAVKMCTGDNVLTARSIALQCGIYSAGGMIMEGPVFRQLEKQDLLELVPRLQVLARSSPEDKKLLVETLRELGEIVGVTGDGTNDGPALKTADVGFSMGIAGTEVAKEASDIILMDDNFASIVKAIMWGRCVNDAVRKFLQFQISTNITAVIITFVSAVASAQEESVLSAVQLLWINIIMDTFAALALATDPASPVLLDRKPDKKTAPLFTVDMYKQILGQSAYQTIITLIFHFLGARILGQTHSDNTSTQNHNNTIVQTLVFNLFVFAQIFNSINSRRLDNHLNVFAGITRNYYFMGITLLEVAVQILIVFVGGAAFQVTRIGGREWGIGLALGFVSLPLGALIRCIPNGPIERFFIMIRLLPNPDVLPTVRDDAQWNSAIQLVRDNLNTFAHVRGGRVRASSYVGKSRNARLAPESRVALPSIMTMVPTLIASSIGAGWAPQSPTGLSNPASFDPSKSSAALWEGKIQIHPETKPDDPVMQRWGAVAKRT